MMRHMPNSRPQKHRFFRIIIVLILTAQCMACSTTKQARTVDKSGFLGNYSNLRKGIGDEPLLLYDNPKADCKKYDAVLIDTVTLWAKDDKSSLKELTPEEHYKLRAAAEKAVRETLERAEYKIVTEPGPSVMKVRAAITEAEKSNVLMEDVTIMAPYVTGPAMALSEGRGQALFTGALAFEIDVIDSMTGERLTASVDKRVGLLDIRNKGEWDNANDVMKSWQDRALQRLKLCRQTGSFEVRPHNSTLDSSLEPYRP